MDRKAALGAAVCALSVVAAFGRPAAAQTIERDGERVEVQVSSHSGASTAVCLESAGSVKGRKRLTVSYGGESGPARLSTGGSDRGPHCVFFEPEGPRFAVRLEYSQLVLLTGVLSDRDFSSEEFRGKTLTFRWVAE